ncbi:MAG TPA: lysine--tRNA ligase [Candidatus Peribacterales bacterium]|nr:lysine--tRNA ligase [Candidatus Peribacterales bacterium]
MIWADRIRDEIKECFAHEIKAKKPLTIRDEKTLSGRVHVGSLRGILIHGLIAQVLEEEDIESKFLFELNDFDPMDGLPVYVDEKTYRPHMGKPLYTVPASEPGHENYAMVFGDELKEVVDRLKLPIEFYTLRPLYIDGKFNGVIREALDHAAEIRAIYKDVSGGGKPDDWYPLSVICEECGKIGTTQVTGWDGEKVTYECKKQYVAWAEGCGHKGTVSPFDGLAKLPWKVEWPAKWKVMNVNIEGAGKDHSAAGGSRAIGARISEEVFHYPNPFDIPYEFFNIGGKKMSASKGLGASAKEVSDLLPPMLLKLLMIRTIPNRPIDFDPEGKTIPNLFDEYDRLADHYFKRHKEPDEDFARTFQLTHLDPKKKPEDLWQMRFSILAFIIQMPHLDLFLEAEKLKGSPLNAAEKEALRERALYVKQWIETLAPAEEKFTILTEVPKDLILDQEQKTALTKLSEALSDSSLPWGGKAVHEKIHAVKEETGINPKKLFEPLYQIFLGRKSGPQVGWFLSTFNREEVCKRLILVLK